MIKVLFTAVALFVAAGPAWAQQPFDFAQGRPDAKWRPWVGCWQLLDESVQDESDVTAEEVAGGGRTGRASRASSGTRVCVTPNNNGVTMTTLIGSEPALEEAVVADGAQHPIVDAECKGSKRSEWSKTGHRLYTTAEISCADQTPRKVSSLTMMTGGPTWVDVQMIDVEGRKSIRVRKFMPIADPAQPRARSTVPFVGETSWTLEDVKEASAKLAPETVQAALVELRAGFNLSSRQLVSLADAGVADNVIDLMIALSYPKKFVVSHPVSSTPSPYGYTYGGLGGAWPWIADAAFWPSYYSPFAYRYWGFYDPYYVPYSGYVYLTPGNPAPGTPSGPVASGDGRVVNGFGYTRVSPREPAPTFRNDFGSNGSNGGMSAGGNSGSSSGGNSGVSSGGGYSSGGGGGDGGRTAVARPPGGN
jgi:uncharacterized membrane protein YgcG